MSINNYNLIKTNYHILKVDSKEFLFHIPTSSVFELSAESANLLRKMENKEEINKDEEEIVEEFKELNIVGSRFFVKEEATKIEHFPAKALVLNVTSGCNLSCTYCYKEDLTSLKNSGQMTFEIAKNAIDMFYKESPHLKEYSITFFGGEPLSNLPLIKEIIAYANDFFGSKDLKIGYSMTSNATLLTEEIIHYLHDSKVDLTISIDGPESLHNKTRVYENGKGSYEKVAKNVAKLLAIYKNRTVGARVTLTRGITDIKTIWNHLRYDLKFKEVGFAPVTSGDNDFFNLSDFDLKKYFLDLENLVKII
ncbi:radical SAM protein [Arcobacter defluvii]|uniref:radical SAM protein n=1 Tax=Arcobacter defluvii TaxID=873191 RepID=UPI001E4E9ADC|nr:radical SAM protein [Arcobacter defluvii]